MKKPHCFAVLAVSLLFCAGCYTYTPVQSPQPGMEVRARLNTEAAIRRSQGLEEPVTRLDGTIIDSTPEAVSLDVLVARVSSAFQDVVIRDTVRLETSEIQSILVRKISPTRSAAFTVLAAAAAFGIVKGIDQVVGGTGENGDGGTPNLRGPLIGAKPRTPWLVLRLPFR